ncbi:MAG: hypothetical protein BWY83_02812 [bacterium ADurb.Bin478]|nr:MAG: hypothetical protein BWY83_02812 [bacterium ADurb.Bin478]
MFYRQKQVKMLRVVRGNDLNHGRPAAKDIESDYGQTDTTDKHDHCLDHIGHGHGSQSAGDRIETDKNRRDDNRQPYRQTEIFIQHDAAGPE